MPKISKLSAAMLVRIVQALMLADAPTGLCLTLVSLVLFVSDFVLCESQGLTGVLHFTSICQR